MEHQNPIIKESQNPNMQSIDLENTNTQPIDPENKNMQPIDPRHGEEVNLEGYEEQGNP